MDRLAQTVSPDLRDGGGLKLALIRERWEHWQSPDSDDVEWLLSEVEYLTLLVRDLLAERGQTAEERE